MLSLFYFSVPGLAQNSDEEIKKNWLIPKGYSIEFAGNFGMFSMGAIYEPLRKTELALTVGYTPPEYGDIWTANALASYNFYRINLNKNLKLYPLRTGMFMNINFGDNIYLNWPSIYTDDYYWWNSSLRFGPFINTELQYNHPGSGIGINYFFQILTNDLYLLTYFPNTESLNIYDILVLGTGIKIYLERGEK